MSARLDYPAAAAFLGLKPSTLRSLVSRGQVPHYRVSAKLVLFDLDEIRTWLQSKRVDVKPRLALVRDDKGAA